LLRVISLNGGWTADPEGNKPSRYLGYTRYDKMAEALGYYAEYVEEPEEIRPALQRAWTKVEEGMVGFVNVKTDYRARATTVRFSSRETWRPPGITKGAPAGAPFLPVAEVGNSRLDGKIPVKNRIRTRNRGWLTAHNAFLIKDLT
jgi:hypothetical protein